MLGRQGLASGSRAIAVRRLQLSNSGQGRNGLSEYEDAVDGVVSGHIVDHASEERSQRAGLQHVLGRGSYQTVWTRLHKLRRAMIRLGRERQEGGVEVNERCLGGTEEKVCGLQGDDHGGGRSGGRRGWPLDRAYSFAAHPIRFVAESTFLR